MTFIYLLFLHYLLSLPPDDDRAIQRRAFAILHTLGSMLNDLDLQMEAVGYAAFVIEDQAAERLLAEREAS